MVFAPTSNDSAEERTAQLFTALHATPVRPVLDPNTPPTTPANEIITVLWRRGRAVNSTVGYLISHDDNYLTVTPTFGPWGNPFSALSIPTSEVLSVQHTTAIPKLIYLSSPHSHPDTVIKELRERQAAEAAAMIYHELRVPVYSPIAHSSNLAKIANLQHTQYDYWQAMDERMILAASEVIILDLPGWEESQGIAAEVVYAHRIGRPVYHIEPATWCPTTYGKGTPID
jgi:hypothetical protein